MALQPAPPVRGYSFTDWQVANPTAPPPGDKLDAEYDRADTTISQTISWAAVSLLTDGTIRHGVVGKPQLVSGLFDDVAQDIIDEVQPMVDQAGAYAASALTSANEADGSAAEAEVANVAAQNAKTSAEVAQAGADLAKVDAQTSAAIAGTKATDAQNHANHAAGDAALAEDWGIVSRDWAEHMPDTIPPNTLAVMGVTGEHWSSRWWAHKAAGAFGAMSELYLGAWEDPPTSTSTGDPIPVGAIYYNSISQQPYVWTGTEWVPFYAPSKALVLTLVYTATAGKTAFPLTTPDMTANTYTINATAPEPVDVHVNGLRKASDASTGGGVGNWTLNPATSTVTFETGLANGDLVQIDVLAPASSLAPSRVQTQALLDFNINPATDLPGQINGTRTSFPLVLAVPPHAPVGVGSPQELFVSLDGVAQQPSVDYSVLGGNIIFSRAPAVGAHTWALWYGPGNPASVFTGYLPLSGGVLSGPLTLNADPAADMQSATRRYVDSRVTTIYTPKGGWNAATNTPTLSNSGGGGVVGDVYTVTVAGTTSLDGNASWAVGDQVQRSATVWLKVAYSAAFGSMAFQNANAVAVTGGSATGMTQVGLVAGDTLLPVSMFVAYRYCVYWVDTAGNICAGILNDGTLETADITTAHILATSLNATTGTVNDLTSTTARFATQSIEPAAGDSWLMLYQYVYTVSDPSGNWAMGLRPTGGYDFASINAAEFTTATRSVTPTGTDQATAAPAASGIISISGVAALGAGVVLVASIGGIWYFENVTGNAVPIYPSTNASLGSLAVNAPLTLDAGATVVLWQSSAIRFGVSQSGGGGAGGTFVGTGFLTPRDIHDRVADTCNVLDFVTGLDPTGAVDNSLLIKSAHDAAAARGYRTMNFPKGTYRADTLTQCGDVIFTGAGNASLVNAYRKRIFPHGIGSGRPPSDVSARFQWSRFLSAVSAATTVAPAKVLVIGDSTTTSALSSPGVSEYLPSLFQRRMAQAFGTKPFTVTELGFGGTVWGDLASASPVALTPKPIWYTDPTKPWTYYVGAYGPFDLIIYNFGQNDGQNFNVTDMLSAISQCAALSSNADLAFITCYCPSINAATTGTKASQEGHEYAAGITRTYADRTGAALFDFHRWGDVLRDGFDPVQGYMVETILTGAITLPYTYTQETSDFACRFTFANQNTMWASGKLQFQLSSNAANLLILEKDSGTGRLAYTVQTIAGVNSIPRTVTGLDLTPAVAVNIKIEVKRGHIFVTFNNVTAVNVQADRFGGLFLPKIFWDSGPGVAPSGTTPSFSVFQPNLYMPQITDTEAFGAQGGSFSPINGNAVNHITTLAQARYMAGVIEASQLA